MTGQDSSPVGDYTYETQFVLAKASGTKFEISGSYGSDNTTLKVLLNGNLLAMNGGGFTDPWPSSFFSDNQDFFVDGPNTLQVIVNNAPGEGLNPTGFVMRGSVVAVVEGVGGSIAGISPTTVICENVSKRKHTVVEVVLAPGARSWDCEAAGLVVSPGDIIKQTVTGTAD
jgi:hypothetical protein